MLKWSASHRSARRRAPPRRAAVLVFLGLAAAYPAGLLGAQRADTLRLHRLSGPVELDGVPDEPAWAGVPSLPMTMYAPTFGDSITEATDIRVAYDDAYLYLGARLDDSNPDGIRVNTLYRDRYSGDDLVAIVLDAFNDYETASWFVVNPAGSRTDRSISNDAEFVGGFPMNEDWNTFWDVATARDEEGWSAEVRIPLSSLGFQDAGGRVVMGMIVYRFIARKNERQIFPAIPPDWPLAFAKPSQAQRILLEGVYSRRPVYVTPYALGGVNRSAALNAPGTAYASDQDVTREAGLDVRYSPTSNLSFDLTVNTDFAQVEADDEQVNLTRFSLFFPEKRQFFQERAAIFDFNTGGQSRLFHSRRIGLVEDEPIRLLGGLRFVGRLGRTDVGFLNMQTAAQGPLPAENFGVLRMRSQVLNPYSNVGGMVTSRLAEDGSANVAVGADAVIRPFGDEYVTLKWVQTFEDGRPGGAFDPDRGRILVRWESRNQRGFSYAADFLRSGSRYDPGVGFVLREDFTLAGGELRYQWFPGAASPFRTVQVQSEGRTFVRNADRTVESASVEPRLQVELKTGEEISLGVIHSYESVREGFDLAGGAPVPVGDYWFHEAQLRFQASRAASFRPTFEVSGGSFFDGTRLSASASPAWNPSRHLELSADYEFNAIRFADRGEELDVHLGRFRIQTALDIHLSLAAFVQYNNTTDEASINARLRYHFREGRDLWLVYNETLNTERSIPGEPLLPRSQSRVVMVKYTHTLIW